MKCLILLALVAVARAGFLSAPAVAHAPAVAVAAPAVLAETGSSVQTRTQDGIGNYNFAYDEAHTTGGSFRRESGSPLGIVKGSYGLRDADGRARIVNYVADAAGFRANIQTNEPGVDPSRDPAATLINKAGVIAAAPAVAAVAAPAYAAPAYAAAPVAAVAPAAVSYSTVAHHAAPVAVAAPAIAAPAYAGYGYHGIAKAGKYLL